MNLVKTSEGYLVIGAEVLERDAQIIASYVRELRVHWPEGRLRPEIALDGTIFKWVLPDGSCPFAFTITV